MEHGNGHLRIGELGRRVGVSPELLRAWERRYGLLQPTRSAGGFRLYTDADEARVRRMLGHLESGIAAAEAARLSDAAQPAAAAAERAPTADASRTELRLALDRFDEPVAHAVLDRLLASFELESVLRDVVLPYLHELGERWQGGELSIAQEHFASALVRGRLLGLARGWGRGTGPLALLTCVSGDEHDLGLICFGLALRNQGWRITFLGPNTPPATTADTARMLRPALVVVSATLFEHAEAAKEALVELARSTPLALAGGGMTARIAAALGAAYLDGDPVTAAERIATRALARTSPGPSGPLPA